MNKLIVLVLPDWGPMTTLAGGLNSQGNIFVEKSVGRIKSCFSLKESDIVFTSAVFIPKTAFPVFAPYIRYADIGNKAIHTLNLKAAPLEFNVSEETKWQDIFREVFKQAADLKLKSCIVLSVFDAFALKYGFWSAIKEKWAKETVTIRDVDAGMEWEPQECWTPKGGATLIFDFQEKECLHLSAQEE